MNTDIPWRHCGFDSRPAQKANISIKQVTQFFWFPSAYKSYIYTILLSIKCAVVLCLKKTKCITTFKKTIAKER